MSGLKVAIIGGRIDGQSGVVLDILKRISSVEIVCIFDHTPELKGQSLNGVSVVGDFLEEYQNYLELFDAIHIAIGDNFSRGQYAKLTKQLGIPLYTLIHEHSVVSPSSSIGEGSFIGPGAIVQNNVEIGRATIVNSGAIVEHDCKLGDAVHLAPRVTLAGRVNVGNEAFLGIGSCVIPDIFIGESSFVAAGSTVVKDVGINDFVVGVPARKKDNIYQTKRDV